MTMLSAKGKTSRKTELRHCEMALKAVRTAQEQLSLLACLSGVSPDDARSYVTAAREISAAVQTLAKVSATLECK